MSALEAYHECQRALQRLIDAQEERFAYVSDGCFAGAPRPDAAEMAYLIAGAFAPIPVVERTGSGR